MTDAAAHAASNGQPATEQVAGGAESVTVAAPAVTSLPPIADERPELVVGAAFAGGLVLALFLKRLAR